MQLARAMTAAGVEVVGIHMHSSRGRARVRRVLPGVPAFGPRDPLPPAAAILLAVPDSAISACAQQLTSRLHPATSLALHTSGLLPAAVLAPLGEKGCHVGSFHPLVSFPTGTGPTVPLSGVVAVVEGDHGAVLGAERLARSLGMRPLRLPASAKPRYHAAAALAANMTYTLVAAARAQLLEVGFPRLLAASALRPLVTGSVEAALSARGFENFTGPIARGDATTIRTHLGVLPGRIATAYWAVASLAIAGLAEQGLISEKQAQELSIALTSKA